MRPDKHRQECIANIICEYDNEPSRIRAIYTATKVTMNYRKLKQKALKSDVKIKPNISSYNDEPLKQ